MKKGPILTLNCKTCNIVFNIPAWRNIPGRKYCSRECKDKGFISPFKGTHIRLNTGRTHFKLGARPWNWKGDEAGYRPLHQWVKRHLGKAFWCTWCFSMVNVQWANISQQYRRNLNDWIQLCGKCHSRYDREGNYGSAARIFNKNSRGEYSTRRIAQ